MPSMYVSINPRKRTIVVEPSFLVTQRAAGELDDIHTIFALRCHNNRVRMSYTYGYELHETLAAVIFTLLEQTFVNVPVETIKITGNPYATEVLPQALEIAMLMDAWARFATEVRANEKLIAEIDQRAETYEQDVRLANLGIKSERERVAQHTSQVRHDLLVDAWFVRGLKQAIAKRRLIATNKRCDPRRKEKAQHRLNELEVEIRNLRPAWRKLVRPELQQLV